MNKEEQKRYDAEKIMAMTNFKKFYPEYQGATVEKIIEKEVEVEVIKEVIKEIIKEIPDPKTESELMELKDLLEFKDDEIKNLKDSLADSLNAEQVAKKECEEAKNSMDSFIRENAKLNIDVIKFKKIIADFTTQ